MLMSKSAYAKHRGVSRQTVYDWVAKGEVVMSGSKIDVEATKKKQNGGAGTKGNSGYDEESPLRISEKAAAVSPDDSSALKIKYQAFSATAKEAKAIVLALDDVYPPAESYAELQARVHDAAGALGLELRLMETEDGEHVCGLEFYDPKQDCIACKFNSPFYELEALTFFRWLIIEKQMSDLKNATKAGLAALSEPFIYEVSAIYNERAEQDSE